MYACMYVCVCLSIEQRGACDFPNEENITRYGIGGYIILIQPNHLSFFLSSPRSFSFSLLFSFCCVVLCGGSVVLLLCGGW